jgi:hypothetical protein
MNKKDIYVLMHGYGYESSDVRVEVFGSRKGAKDRARSIAEKCWLEDVAIDEDLDEDEAEKKVKKISMKKLTEKLWPAVFWHEIKKQKVNG